MDEGLKVARVSGTVSSKFTNGRDVTIMIYREADDIANVVTVQFAVQSTDEVIESIKNTPATYFMHGSAGDVAERAIQTNGLRDAGLRALKELIDMGYVNMVESADAVVAQIRDIRNTPGISASASLDEVLVSQPKVRRAADGSIESMNVGISFLKDKTPYETFSLKFAFPSNSSVEKINRILSTMTHAIQ